MNLRRGFFRLWLVLSILYVAAIGAIFFNDVKGEFDKARNPFYAADMLSLPVACKDARGTEGTDYFMEGPWVDYQGREKFCWYQEPNSGRCGPNIRM
jgi:hypothetical protein